MLFVAVTIRSETIKFSLKKCGRKKEAIQSTQKKKESNSALKTLNKEI